MNHDSALSRRLQAEPNHLEASALTGAVSWPAIVAGATGAASLSLVLLILGTGLGLSSASPWSDQGVSATAIVGAFCASPAATFGGRHRDRL